AEYGQRQLAAGHSAWQSPAIFAWQDWLVERLATVAHRESLPIRINAEQSRWLWDRCLSRAIADPLINVPLLTRQSLDAWRRLQDWAVPLDECGARANGRDRRLFARVAADYASELQRENWIDEACLGGLVERHIVRRTMPLPQRLAVAGFDRLTPQQNRILDALGTAGCQVTHIRDQKQPGSIEVRQFADPDAELRAAGSWARQTLASNASQRVGIVVSRLEQASRRAGRLVREGFMPGWQDLPPRQQALVNVSYGQRLSDNPAITIGLLALRWLAQELPGREVAQLLRSDFVGRYTGGGRARLELKLRDLPDRLWAPMMLQAEMTGQDESRDAIDWERCLAVFEQYRDSVRGTAAPSQWALVIDRLLKALGWPGASTLDSAEFQLVNRWRELLNELARLDLISPAISYSEAIARLGSMAADVVFQAEAEQPVLEVMGELEAAGMEFDSLWIAGLTSDNWPPAKRPSPLLSRELQRDYGMPDAEPADTLDYAQRVIDRLLLSATTVIGSYAQSVGDAEQTLTPLLPVELAKPSVVGSDPGWYAAALRARTSNIVEPVDHVPPVQRGESLSGGAALVQWQMNEPFSAFAFGRLGVRQLPRLLPGLSARVRGILIHDALRRLYADLPRHEDVCAWSRQDIDRRVESAVRQACFRLGKNADPLLRRLLAFEQARIADLLRSVIDIDREREWSDIDSVESALEFELDGVGLKLRF
ncbi:MAG: hypothetical protein KJO55_09865, partial [Gammaproteobacteria bacterium]|nr:hypothetical protein [Gammaproteobacteria bacterium]